MSNDVDDPTNMVRGAAVLNFAANVISVDAKSTLEQLFAPSLPSPELSHKSEDTGDRFRFGSSDGLHHIVDREQQELETCRRELVKTALKVVTEIRMQRELRAHAKLEKRMKLFPATTEGVLSTPGTVDGIAADDSVDAPFVQELKSNEAKIQAFCEKHAEGMVVVYPDTTPVYTENTSEILAQVDPVAQAHPKEPLSLS
jgi:hypothetical protein